MKVNVLKHYNLMIKLKPLLKFQRCLVHIKEKVVLKISLITFIMENYIKKWKIYILKEVYSLLMDMYLMVKQN
jgi:hypothetical protein